MISKWKVFNFKSISDETELELSPLTIFAGANSSGKSTFIQSMLLIAQTLEHKVGSRPVVLNGSLTSLGQFDDLKSNGGVSDQVTIKCICRPFQEQESTMVRRLKNRNLYRHSPEDYIKEISCEISFDADLSSPHRDLLQIQPRLFATQLSCISRDEDDADQNANIYIRHRSVSDSVGEIDDEITHIVEIDDESMREVRDRFSSAKPMGCTLKHFLPGWITYEFDSIEEDAKNITQAIQRGGRMFARLPYGVGGDFRLSKEIVDILRSILADVIDFDKIFGTDDLTLDGGLTLEQLRQTLRQLKREEHIKIMRALGECDDLLERIHEVMKKEPQHTEISHALLKPPSLIHLSAEYLEKFFSSSFRYLGPLRDAPKPVYPLAPAADPNDIGVRGEHTAYILELHKNKRINYIPSGNFAEDKIGRNTSNRTLETAVNDWLQYLGVAGSAQSRDKGKLGHELKVKLPNSENEHDLTHVGVGVSQVLPILVMCFLADTDSTLVFEQPELHLHPKVQTLLGDFFLSMALSNKQCIIETHSEYLVDRLRFRIASASPKEELNSKAKVYFVEKPAQDSTFREVVINEYGAITDWPDEFFDQSQQQAEKILKAASKKRKTKRDSQSA